LIQMKSQRITITKLFVSTKPALAVERKRMETILDTKEALRVAIANIQAIKIYDTILPN
jgi:hypothetical protein